MGKRSVKENKNIYQRSRENRGLSREAAAEELVYLSADRIEKIESGRSEPHPDEVLAMERGYGDPELCNYYCAHECPIGRKYVPAAALKDFAQVTVELLSSVHKLEEERDSLIAIAVDGRVNDFERRDFDRILEKLSAVDRSIRGMRIWLEHAAQTGKLDEAQDL